MMITDMRMETMPPASRSSRRRASAAYHPAVALLTAFPVAEEDWQEMGADKLLVKPMHTRILLEQIEDLIASHERKLIELGLPSPSAKPPQPAAEKRASAKKLPAKKPAARRPVKKLAKTKAAAKKAASQPKARAAAKSAAKKARPSLRRKP